MPSRAHAREPDTDPVFLSLPLFLFKGVWGIFLFFFMGEGGLCWHGGEKAARHGCGFLAHCFFLLSLLAAKCLVRDDMENRRWDFWDLWDSIPKSHHPNPIFTGRNALYFFRGFA